MRLKDHFLTGLLLGILVPILGYFILKLIYSQFDVLGLTNGEGLPLSFRPRTTALLAICCNLITLQVLQKKKWDTSLRGLVFPTLGYVVWWMLQYGRELL